MRPILVLIRKEFQQILRDRPMMGSILVMPLIQLLILSYAVTTDVKHLKLAVLDEDRSSLSRHTTSALENSGFFDLVRRPGSRLDIESAISAGRADLAVIFPVHFDRDVQTERSPAIQIIVDGQNSNSSTIGLGYASRILQSLSRDIIVEKLTASGQAQRLRLIEAASRVWYNPDLKSVFYMIPGIITIMLTVSTMLLSAMGLVREKEIGTFEQLMVTPIRPAQLLIGKLVPFALLGLLQLSLSLLVGLIWFRLPFEGNPLWIYLAAILFMLATLGMGLFVSTITSTQQQALFIAWFFMIFGLIMSGFFAPIENMVPWAQTVSLFNPLRYLIAIMRAVLLKGSGLQHLWPEFLMLAALGVTILGLTVARFRSRIA
jgi:ABC-2 type transport system permease protein